jgi:hypothetical protein
MLAFQVVRVAFPTTTGREQTVNSFADFNTTVRAAHVAINGFDTSYRNGDHHLGELKIDCSGSPSSSGRRVNFAVNFLLRDFSGNIDDPYAGWVDVLVIADVQ